MKKIDLKSQSKLILGMTKVNFKLSKASYIVVIAVLGTIVLSNVGWIISRSGGFFATGTAFFLLPVMMAIFIPVSHFSKFLNLGAKRTDFFKSCIFTYFIAATAATLSYMLLRYIVDKPLCAIVDGAERTWYAAHNPDMLIGSNGPFVEVLDMFDAFRFKGAIGALQMIAFLFFISCMTHTVALIQKKWYGWVADAVVFSWFILLPLMTMDKPDIILPVIKWFYDLIIFNKYAAVQILCCLVLGAGIYALSIFPIKNKKM